ncbi:cytochrome P450 [Aspergillus indologenus CBS 114.80]|uniref:Cytochrome P450 n=1 Tax=Aspergillus indologenus CBS 114.80 TaxID=1450541 RepID=A0A2V5J0U3_9EURO|nr:cytochrome P450 [Aspergillus indologenus CBS 114.80]
MWRNWHYWRGQWHDVVLALHARYGRVVRIAPNEVSIVDEAAARALYGHGTPVVKTDWYATWDIPGTAAGLFATRDRAEHRFLRRRVSRAYSMTAILEFEAHIQGCFDLLLEQLAARADTGDVVDMADWTNAVTYDVVGELAYGAPLGHVRTGSDVLGIRQAILTGFFWMANLGHYPGQPSRFLNHPALAAVLRGLGVPNSFLRFREWSVTRVRARMQERSAAGPPDQSPRKDMLHHFVQMKDAQGNPASEGEVLIEAMNIIGAGADTTAIGMRACLYYVCTHPAVYKRLQREIDEYFAARPDQQGIPYNEARQLPYLHAVVSEATRLHPSIVYQLLRRPPSPGGLTVAGHTIPAGTTVGISPRAQNRDRAVWGEDADCFRPERWLDDPGRARYFESVSMTFGGNGPRMCIGRNIALVEIFKFLALMLHTFDIELVDSTRPWRLETFWFAYQHEMYVRLWKRAKG